MPAQPNPRPTLNPFKPNPGADDPEATPAVEPEPETPQEPEAKGPAAVAVAEADPRVRWICVTQDGPRTNCSPFHSDDHRFGRHVVCPTCGSRSVRVAIKASDNHPWIKDDE